MRVSPESETFVFIINPVSACGSTLRFWSAAREHLKHRGIVGVERMTRGPGHAVELTRAALLGGAVRVVAVGGDGTLNEVVNGYLQCQETIHRERVALGFLPSGTGADVRRTLGLHTLQDAVAALASPQTQLLDAVLARLMGCRGSPTSRYLLNMATLGLGGQVARLVNLWRDRLPRWIGGRARYAGAVLWALSQYRNVPIEVGIDNQTPIRLQSNLLVVANGRFAGGGMMLAPHAGMLDGALDIIIAEGATPMDILRELPRIQRGGHLNHPKILELQGREVSIHSHVPLAVEIDGETAGFTPVHFSVLPSAVRFAISS